MITKDELIDQCEDFIPWVQMLDEYDEATLFQPIKEGKWSVAEVLSHIMFWDKYVLEVSLPQMKANADVESAKDYQEINELASAYALAEGTTLEQLIKELVDSRLRLVAKLREKTADEFLAKFKINGEEIDQFSGYPHSLYSYISGFVWHDNHHKKQIESYLEHRKR